VALVVVAGCGGDDDDADTTAAATSEATSEATATTGEAEASGALEGTVGPGFDISMAQTTTAPGTYELTVDDQAGNHNFHITGEGVDVATDVGASGSETFTVTLAAGTYTFVCDPHADSMKGTLTVE